jgi:alpha-D-glucose phosphate-specific phosphoglucomutase
VALLTQAVADYLKESTKKAAPKVCLGYDARFQSKEFSEIVAEVLAGNGVKVVLSDRIVPTPVVSYYTKYEKCDLGIVITASHNPHQYNGYKLKTPDGGSAGSDVTKAVEGLLEKNPVKRISLADAQKKGLVKMEDTSVGYYKFITKYVDIAKIKKAKLNVVVDLMYGAGDDYIRRALSGKGSKVTVDYIRSEYNPSFGRVNPEPIEDNVQPLIKAMKSGKYDLGVALDGDADRIAIVLKGGRYINAQVLVPLLGVHLVKNKKWDGGIVKTVVGSNVFDNVAKDLGRELFETPVGFKYISELFVKKGALIGGEEAGGIGFKNYIPERDGSVAAMLLLEMSAMMKKTPVELVADFEKRYGKWTYAKSSVTASDKIKDGLKTLKIPTELLKKKVIGTNTADGTKIMTKDSWLMFRASGTEPIVRCYSEAHTKKEAEALLEQGMKILKSLA